MSRPTEEQATQLVERMAQTLQEWDDCEFAVCILIEGRWEVFAKRVSETSAVRIARNLLNDVLENG